MDCRKGSPLILSHAALFAASTLMACAANSGAMRKLLL